ncbi:nucleotidyltransferase domain-containing protein [Tengunoibacter tsumagoiensis]|uniref:Polymerase nucleotidyl transferase domain-containing protein n=1 Tax=Tengunoibacter tsumagoiensis TaxID=2014871 RepID=A0A402A333_9CHLR|nr:nucleotidyltransferase domain-containing protein [Tengunoibacter tsumagoiensis]GCE13455.1 hypothetical protein KTT_33140 [Tengunoibacter tsumagoiensis]
MLTFSTQQPALDQVLELLIQSFEEAFPDRIRSYYVEGSLANRSTVSTSDIDLLLIFKGRFVDEAESQRVEALAERLAQTSPIELDLDWKDELRLQEGVWPALKFGSELVYGEEIRDQLPLISLEQWTRDRMHSSFWRTGHLFHRTLPLDYPLQYPQPDEEFYGYDQRTVQLKDGREVKSTRDLIRLVGWSATALIAYQAGQYVARKSDCHQMYRKYVADDQLADLLQEIYELCRGRWNYLLPEDPAERRKLRSICEQTLRFENHFLLLYKEYLLQELAQQNVSAQQQALFFLRMTPYRDQTIDATLNALTYSPHEEIALTAKEILRPL